MPEQEPTFLDFLRDLEDGRFAAELTDQLQSLVAQMHQHARDVGGKPVGKLTIGLTMKLDGGMFDVVATSGMTPPKPVRARSLFYRTNDNRLTANNPRQLELEVRDVSTPAPRAIRSIS